MDMMPNLLWKTHEQRQAEKPAEKPVVTLAATPEHLLTVTRQVRRLKVACVSVPEAGHLVPTVQVAKALARRGHQTSLVTFDCAREKFAKGCEAVGCQFVGLAEGMLGSDAGSGLAWELTSKGLIGMLFRHQDLAMREELVRWLQVEQPDVILSDFTTLAAVHAARECGIPLVLNIPGPLELFKNISVSLVVTMCTASLFLTRSFTDTRILMEVMTDLIPIFKQHLCLVHSFFGLDVAAPLLPNIVMTGSTAPRPGTTVLRETTDERFNAWLQQVRGMGLRIVYVTMGSMQVLEPFQVKALFEGLMALSPRCAVAWSLKQEQQALLPETPPHFFVQKWMPQGEALQLPDVSVVVTHCGFGGLNETIAAGKPMVALPFRADQPANAKVARARGLAEVLQPSTLTAAAVTSAVSKVLGNESYARRAQELQRLMLKTGGSEACVDAIERFVEHGGCQELLVREPSWQQTFRSALIPLSLVAAGAAGVCLLQRFMRPTGAETS